MVVEHAVISVTPGREQEFEELFPTARAVITAAQGCHWAELHRFVERPSVFLLLVGWTSVEAHEAFRASDAFGVWRGHIGPFFAGPPVVEHLTAVTAGVVPAAG